MNGAYSGQEVRISGLTRAFDGRAVLDNLNLSLPAGQFVALLGRSGSGKSTLLRALAGLDEDVSGTGIIEVPEARSVLFQDSRLLPWESVLSNITLGLQGADAEHRAHTALADVGLAGREHAWPNQLSGGEQQRAALARSLVRRPQFLLADEPFGALDALTRLNMHALLRSVVERDRPTVLLITHDVDEALALAERILILDHGRIVKDLPVPRAQDNSQQHPHLRQQLLQSLGVNQLSLESSLS